MSAFSLVSAGGFVSRPAVLGLVISFLGAFCYYGIVHFATKDTSQNTMEWITGDYTWNPALGYFGYGWMIPGSLS